MHRIYTTVADGCGVLASMFVDRESATGRIETVQSRRVRAKPQRPIGPLYKFQIQYFLAPLAERIPLKMSVRGIEPIESVPSRGPQSTVVIYQQPRDNVVA